LMRAMREMIKDRNGTYYAQRKVPKRLQGEVAAVLNHSTGRKPFLKKSLGTKVLSQANISAKPVLMEFDRIIRAAEALKNAKPPLRDSLSSAEIGRMAEYVFAKALEWDERLRVGGRDELKRMGIELQKQLKKEGRELGPPAYRYEDLPAHGLSIGQLNDDREQLKGDLSAMQDALALGDISAVDDHTLEALDVFGINLDPTSLSRPQLGIAVLRAYVRALQAIEKRHRGEPVETPKFTHSALSTPTANGTLRDAVAGWEKERARAAGTVHEYRRAIEMFIQLHGNLPVVDIRRTHAREFREAFQQVPSVRRGKLRDATLPELSTWGLKHPEVPKVSPGTVNKQLGALQAIVGWAHHNGIVPDDIAWSDPFHKMRVEEEQSGREPFVVSELQKIFDAPLFTAHEWPEGAKGAAGVWLPLLALFNGARQAELAGLKVSNVQNDAATGTTLIFIVAERKAGKSLKTRSSERVVPIHPELVKLGFLKYVAERRRDGADAWLFPLIAPEKGRARLSAWSKWFGRYLRRKAGVVDTNKVFHSFRHKFSDGATRGGVDAEVRKALMGHSDGSVSGGYGSAAMLERFGVKVLRSAMAKIVYPGLNLSRVRPGGVGRRTGNRS
jgi:integrase